MSRWNIWPTPGIAGSAHWTEVKSNHVNVSATESDSRCLHHVRLRGWHSTASTVLWSWCEWLAFPVWCHCKWQMQERGEDDTHPDHCACTMCHTNLESRTTQSAHRDSGTYVTVSFCLVNNSLEVLTRRWIRRSGAGSVCSYDSGLLLAWDRLRRNTVALTADWVSATITL